MESEQCVHIILHNNFTYNFGSTNKKDNSTRWRYVKITCDAKLLI